jgi:FAD/FMN-containing dehydrogenase
MAANKAALAALIEALGSDGFTTDPDRLAPHLVEWRKLYTGTADGLALPRDTASVAKVMAIAHEHRIPVTPQGGRTGLVGGGVPDGGIILSLERLRTIRAIDSLSGSVTAEAGVTLMQVQQAAEAQGLLFPLSLASEGSCSIGGNLATNAGGTAVLRYGNARDLCLGLEVVLADGRRLDGLKALRKDNAGYDLKQLFIGSEGTLGIITAATLKLFPQPKSRSTAFIGASSPHAVVALFQRLRDGFAEALTTFEILPRFGLDCVLACEPGARDPFTAPYPWYALIEFSSGRADAMLSAQLETALGNALEDETILDAVIAASLRERNDFWKLREALSDSQGIEGASIKHDISVPLSAMADFMVETMAACEAHLPGLRPCPFGHVGDGNLHFNLTQPKGMDRAAYLALWPAFNRIVHDRVLAVNGSIAAEHGVGIQKREELERSRSDAGLAVMRAMKLALDPLNILNPGKVLLPKA